MPKIKREDYSGIYSKILEKTSNNKNILKSITSDYSRLSPHVNGFYYIGMVHGPWIKQYNEFISENTNKDLIITSTKLPSAITPGNFGKDQSSDNILTGTLATDIDIPQFNIEYDTITGKSHNINYASRLNYTGDFNINYIDTSGLNVFRYHTAWTQYISLLKKGYIKLNDNSIKKNESYFIDIPYFNSVYVLLFEPFSTKVKGVILIMGVSPINVPFKQIIGDRSKSSLTTISQNYKSNDIFWTLFDTPVDISNSSSTDILLKKAIDDLKLI